MIMDWIVSLSGWWSSLSPAATFLFIIPFAVAAAGLVAEVASRRRRPRRDAAAPACRPGVP